MTRWNTSDWLSSVLTLVVSALIVFYFFDHGWFAPDDGYYADIAERLLQGDRLHSDIRSVFPGYTHFLNAAALSLFEPSLSGIRLPLVLISLAFSLAIAIVVGGYRGSIAGISSICCGPVVFMNPSSSWYALYAALTLALLAYSSRRWNQISTLLLAGMILGACLMFRQLSGATLAVGLLLAISASDVEPKTSRSQHLSIAAVLAGAGINFYLLVFQGNLFSWLLFGAAPSFIAAIELRTIQDYRTQIRDLSLVALGGIAAMIPLVFINAWNGTLVRFLSEISISAIAIPKLDFIQQSGYDLLLIDSISGIFNAITSQNPLGILASLCIACLVLAPLALLLRIAGIRWGNLELRQKRAIAIITGFAASSAHFPSLIYLVYTAPIVLLGHVMLNTRSNEYGDAGTPSSRDWVILAISGASLLGLAGRPITGTASDLFAAKPVPHSHVSWIPRLNLTIPSHEAREITDLVTRINQWIEPDDPIFVFPANAALYFLTEGKNETQFYYAGFGVPDCSSLVDFSRYLISQSGPQLIVHVIHEKYETAVTRSLKYWLDTQFEIAWELHGARAYRRPALNQMEPPICLNAEEGELRRI